MSLDSLILRENIFFKQRIQLHRAYGLGVAVEMVGADAMKQISCISAFYVSTLGEGWMHLSQLLFLFLKLIAL